MRNGLILIDPPQVITELYPYTTVGIAVYDDFFSCMCAAEFLCELDIYIYIYIKSKGICQPENLMSNGSSRHDDAAQTK
jgi:hypothetical protein